MQRPDEAEAHQDREHHELNPEQDEIDLRRRLYAQVVDHGREGEHRHDPHRPRHAGPHRLERDGRGDVSERRQQQIVEQDRPARHEADPGADAARGIGVDRARDGERLAHQPVAPRREQHRAKPDQVDQRHHAVRGIEDDAEHRERRARNDEDEAVDEQIEQGQRALELLAVTEGFEVSIPNRLSINHAPSLPPPLWGGRKMRSIFRVGARPQGGWIPPTRRARFAARVDLPTRLRLRLRRGNENSLARRSEAEAARGR